MNERKPHITIKTEGINGTEIYVDGYKLDGVAGFRFSQSYKENCGLPILQIDLKATNVSLDAKILPALPQPFSGFYLPISAFNELKGVSDEEKIRICRKYGIEL